MSGSRPKIIVRAVIRIGRRRTLAAPTAACMSDMPASRRLFNGFCKLVTEHCYTQHEVKFYADRLCITPYYLSKITARIAEMRPKQLIDWQIVMEIKHLLTSTDLTIKEIADRFHFDSASYLGRYFRRHTGLTPTEFREQ